MLINVQLEVARGADNDERKHNHRREDREANAQFSQSLHGWLNYSLTITFSPSVILPGLRPARSPALMPSTISTPSSARRPVLIRFSETLPSPTTKTRSMPAKVVIEAAGANNARYPAATTISARENAPGRRIAEVLETSVSTSSVRLVSSKDGLIRATRPL